MAVGTEFSIDNQNGVPVVKITGDLDHHSTPRLRSIMQELVEEGHKNAIIDMSAVEFVDSAGMSGMIFGAKRLSAAGGRLALATCNSRIERKLNIGGLTQLTSILTLHESVEQAVQDLKKT